MSAPTEHQHRDRDWWLQNYPTMSGAKRAAAIQAANHCIHCKRGMIEASPELIPPLQTGEGD